MVWFAWLRIAIRISQGSEIQDLRDLSGISRSFSGGPFFGFGDKDFRAILARSDNRSDRAMSDGFADRHP